MGVAIAIYKHWALRGYSPTVRWIQEERKLSSTSVVDYHLQALRDKHYVQGCGRALMLTEAGVKAVESSGDPDLQLLYSGRAGRPPFRLANELASFGSPSILVRNPVKKEEAQPV